MVRDMMAQANIHFFLGDMLLIVADALNPVLYKSVPSH